MRRRRDGHPGTTRGHGDGSRRVSGLGTSRALLLVMLGGLAFAVLVALVGAAQPAHAAALAGSVTFQHRDYDVHIQSNGDVSVAEHWDVQFTGGPYTTAHLDLYLADTSGIDFGTVDGATPGSQQVHDTVDSRGTSMREVTWNYSSAQDTTRAFTIPYTIHSAVGLNSSQAWLDWHFLDGNGTSDFPVDSSTVTETLPAPASSGVQVTATYPGQQPQTATPTPSTITASAQNLNSGQPFEVVVVFPRSALDASVQAPSWQQGDTPPTPPTSFPGSGSTSTGGSGSSGGLPGIGGGTTDTGSPGIGPGGFGSIFSGLCGSLPCLGFIVLAILSLISRLAWRHSGAGGPARGWGYGRPFGWWGGPYGGGYGPYGGYGAGPRAPIFGGGGTPPGGGMSGGGSGFGGGGGGGSGGGGGGGGGGSSGFG